MLQSYLSTLSSVISSVEDYGFLLRRSLGQALIFFMVTMSLLSLSTSLHYSLRQLPSLKSALFATFLEVQTHYPDDLVFNWNGQNLQTTGTPLSVQYPLAFDPAEYELPQHLSLILPQDTNVEELTQNTALTVITPSNFHLRNQSNQWSNTSLKSLFPDTAPFTLSKANLPSFASQAEQTLQTALDFTAQIFYVLGPIWLIIMRGWGVLIDSFLMFISLRLWSRRASWQRCLKLALYLSIPAEIVFQATRWLYPQLQLPMFMITFWVLFVVMLFLHRNSLTE